MTDGQLARVSAQALTAGEPAANVARVSVRSLTNIITIIDAKVAQLNARVLMTLVAGPSAPVLTGSQTAPRTVTLHWNTPANGGSVITGYVIERAPDASGAPGAWATIATRGIGTAYTDQDIEAGLTYWWRVSAINAVAIGAPSNQVTVAVSPALPGCPLGADYPGWNVLVEAYFTLDPGRTYGQLNYGDEVYGDLDWIGPTWNDITEPTMGITIICGGTDGNPVVPVNEYQLEFHDDTGEYWEFAEPARYNLPTVSTPIRISLFGPTGGGVLGTGHIESIVDEHDTLPRFVTVTAYGKL